MLIGLVLIVWGLFRADEDGGRVMLLCGMALASLAGLETALREHFSGFRSHALLLAALPAVVVAGVLFFARAPWVSIPIATALVFGTGFLLPPSAAAARLSGTDGHRRKAHAAARAAPRDRDLPRR